MQCHSSIEYLMLLHIWFISLAYGYSCMMHNLSKMIVIPYSAGGARLSWRCQLSAHACVQDIQDILRIQRI